MTDNCKSFKACDLTGAESSKGPLLPQWGGALGAAAVLEGKAWSSTRRPLIAGSPWIVVVCSSKHSCERGVGHAFLHACHHATIHLYSHARCREPCMKGSELSSIEGTSLGMSGFSSHGPVLTKSRPEVMAIADAASGTSRLLLERDRTRISGSVSMLAAGVIRIHRRTLKVVLVTDGGWEIR